MTKKASRREKERLKEVSSKTPVSTTEAKEVKTIGDAISAIEIKNPVVKKMWQAVRYIFIGLGFPFKVIYKLISLPVKALINTNKMLKSDPKTRHVQEALTWFIILLTSFLGITVETTVVSFFIYQMLINAANAANNIDANYYVKRADSINVINSIVVAVFIIFVAKQILKRYKNFKTETHRLKTIDTTK